MKKLFVLACATVALNSFGILNGISPAITPEALKVLDEMGHGDELVIGDANFPAHQLGIPVIHSEGSSAGDILAGLNPLINLDTYAIPVVMMAPLPGDELDPTVEAKYRRALGNYTGKVERMDYREFYKRARNARAVIRTSESAKYGNVIIKKGIIKAEFPKY